MKDASSATNAAPVDLRATARLALACLDLTSLNDTDTEADIARLCRRAQSPFGPVAAVCVWPRFVAFARQALPANIAVAAVANFPGGGSDVGLALRDVGEIVRAGGDEVDVVLPYAALQRGDDAAVSAVLAAVRAACPGLALKVILETGVLVDQGLIARASRLSLDAGADFLKTSTGKTPVSATMAAAETMLLAIAAHPQGAARAGLKVAGGLRTVAESASYIALCERLLGRLALQPRRFRIGASSLLDDIEAVLGDRASLSAAPDASAGPY